MGDRHRRRHQYPFGVSVHTFNRKCLSIRSILLILKCASDSGFFSFFFTWHLKISKQLEVTSSIFCMFYHFVTFHLLVTWCITQHASLSWMYDDVVNRNDDNNWSGNKTIFVTYNVSRYSDGNWAMWLCHITLLNFRRCRYSMVYNISAEILLKFKLSLLSFIIHYHLVNVEETTTLSNRMMTIWRHFPLDDQYDPMDYLLILICPSKHCLLNDNMDRTVQR